MKTVKEILDKAPLGTILKAKTLYWIVTEKSDVTVAQPFNIRTKKKIKNTNSDKYFELWNCGAESIAVIPELKVYK
jgi:hypothetical protein